MSRQRSVGVEFPGQGSTVGLRSFVCVGREEEGGV